MGAKTEMLLNRCFLTNDYSVTARQADPKNPLLLRGIITEEGSPMDECFCPSSERWDGRMLLVILINVFVYSFCCCLFFVFFDGNVSFLREALYFFRTAKSVCPF